MSGDNVDDVSIPMVFLFTQEGRKLMEAYEKNPELEVYLAHKSKTFGKRRVMLREDALKHRRLLIM